MARPEWHRLRVLIVVTLVVLTVQGWFGDSVNLFAVFPSGAVDSSANGLFQAVLNVGPQ